MSSVDRRKFWDRKILGWERNRYGRRPSRSALFEFLAHRNGSVRYRRTRAAEILEPLVAGQRLLDLGCGSGLLFQDLAHTQAGGFMGLDWAPSAIEEGRRRAEAGGYSARTRFIETDISGDKLPDSDLVVGLGLLDWLEPAQIKQLAQQVGDRQFLFSFSEDRPSIFKELHKLYTLLSYGLRTGGYRPRYHAAEELCSLFTGSQVLRESPLGFGAFLHNLGDGAGRVSHQQRVDRYFLKRWEGNGRGPNRRLRERETAAVKAAIAPVNGLEILELGCGNGWYLEQLLSMGPSAYVGCDRHPRVQLPESTHTEVSVFSADIGRLKLERRFDRVLCAGLLEFLPEPEQLLSALPGLLKPGGRAVLVYPEEGLAGTVYRLFHRRNGYEIRLFRSLEVIELLRLQGFELTHRHTISRFSTVLAVQLA